MKTLMLQGAMLGTMMLTACVSSGGSRYHEYDGGRPDQVTPAAITALNNNHPENVLCWQAKPVGSHLLETYCATKEEVAMQNKKDRDAFFWMTTGSPKFSGPGG